MLFTCTAKRMENDQSVEMLEKAVKNTLTLADEKNIKIVAFPPIASEA